MDRRVRKLIIDNGLIDSGSIVGAAVSGGPDSMCLLDILHRQQKALKIGGLLCIHVNHMLRGQAADEDEQYVREWCDVRGIPFFCERIPVGRIAEEKGISVELAAREARYEYLEQVCRQQGAALLAVAHNMNDQAETVMMRIIRGSGLKGISAMEMRRDMGGGLGLIRPLLTTSREDIEAYCNARGLNPRTDRTNLESVYTRNKIRLDLFPWLKENFNENIEATLCRLALAAGEAQAALEGQVGAFMQENWKPASPEEMPEEMREGLAEIRRTGQVWDSAAAVWGSIPSQALRRQPDGLKKLIIIEAFRRAGLEKDIASVHIDGALRIINSGAGKKTAEFPAGYIMRSEAGFLWFAKIKSEKMFEKRNSGV